MIEPYLAHCQHTIAQHGGVLTTLFIAGVAGSFTHCAGMCGPFVVAQTTARLNDISVAGMNEWQRLKGAALLPYHLGRVTTYATLGILVSSLTQAVVMTTGFRLLNALLLLTAGILFLMMVVGNIKSAHLKFRVPLIVQIQSFFSAKAKTFLFHPTGINGYIAGVLLGFLPCSLLYTALLIVSAADPVTAASGMVLFGLGTIPSLFMIAYGANYTGQKFRSAVKTTGRIFMLVNGIVLIALAIQKLG